MPLKSWMLLCLAFLLVIGSTGITHWWLVSTTSSAMEYHEAAGWLLGIGDEIRTWLFAPGLAGIALITWIRTRQSVFGYLTLAFVTLFIHAASFQGFLWFVRQRIFRFTHHSRDWWFVVWVLCLLAAFSLLAYGLAIAARVLSRRAAPEFAGTHPPRRVFQFHLWHLAAVIVAICPFLAIARLVIPALDLNVAEYFVWSWRYLLLAVIYLVASLAVFGVWRSSKSEGIFTFALALGLSLIWYLLQASIGGDKIANVRPESPFYDFLLVRGPIDFWIPASGDILFLIGICLLRRELKSVDATQL